MYYIGIISGTSADAVDAALLRIGANGASLRHSISRRYPDSLRRQVVGVDAATTIQQSMRLDARLGSLFAKAALQLIAEAGVARAEIRAIGSHGQTLWHAPGGAGGNTLQVGDPNRIAFLTGIVTVSDFRRMDMAAGGQGAPLAPAFHDWQFKLGRNRACVVNIGGISNITIPGKLAGYDIGPGNCLMDSWIRHCKGRRMDRDGAWAATGEVHEKLLRAMSQDGYFSKRPPKSTGREYFNLQWIQRHCRRYRCRPQDVQATLAQLTADTIALAVTRRAKSCRKLLICGGGWHNKALMQKLGQQLPRHTVQSTAVAGIPPDDVEAAAFAWLAWRRLTGRPGTATTVTGASKPVVLGAIYQPKPSKRR